ncbi:hypothetical protein CBR_g19654 [Chara braunii]|uniref:ABC transporter domain-containing protein n=1 Tax=Chara braunii TaxID=69332 RepID=A0A388KYM4_CHABU|nr:hypothetical protein CBR_g19654 [Chara braunii]|eukprot:GBG75141.1 hypothetical protein CBR_g19654 [Chara braunii]
MDGTQRGSGGQVDLESNTNIGRRREALKSSFLVQADALGRKNLRLQSRQWGSNACLVSFPIMLFLLIVALQLVFDKLLFGGSDFKCGCSKEGVCGLEYSNTNQIPWCAIPNPFLNPALLQMPNVPIGQKIDQLTAIIPVAGVDQRVAEAIGNRLLERNDGLAGGTSGVVPPGVDVDVNDDQGDSGTVDVTNPLTAISVLPLPDKGGLTATGRVAAIAGTSAWPTLGAPMVEILLTMQEPEDHLFILSNHCMPSPNNTWQLETVKLKAEVLGEISFLRGSSGSLSLPVGCYEARATFFPSSFDRDFLEGVYPEFSGDEGGAGGGDHSSSRNNLKRTTGFSTSVDAFLYNRYVDARPKKAELAEGHVYIPGVIAAYDFKSTCINHLDLHVWLNRTYYPGQNSAPAYTLRLARSFNLAMNAFVSWLTSIEGGEERGKEVNGTLLPLLYVKEFPKVGTSLQLDVSAFVGPLFFTWVLSLVLPIIVSNLVYEKERRLRSMMKMHGLGDVAYWCISYLYFFVISVLYMLFFVVMGHIVRIKFFLLNNTALLLLFLFIFFNHQVAFGFCWASIFGSVKTATVSSYLYVFGSGLLANFLFLLFLEDPHTSSKSLFAMELVPAFALYRGLYEFAEYSFVANYQSSDGMSWGNLSDEKNGLVTVMRILVVEWIILLTLALYLDQVVDTGAGVPQHPLFFIYWAIEKLGQVVGRGGGGRKTAAIANKPAASGLSRMFFWHGKSPSTTARNVYEGEDIKAEREVVKAALQEEAMATTTTTSSSTATAALQEEAMATTTTTSSSTATASASASSPAKTSSSYSILCDDLQKVFKGVDGNPDKYAVRGMSLAVGRGECFGMLGPNGAGKTTSISMMVGFLEPSAGTALIEGMDIRTDMHSIHSVMGVCPQHDLLWESLTGREHLFFFGRLKNLKGKQLDQEVEMWLRRMNLFSGGVEGKQVQAYSGGMKRRLSVAISLIGDPLVVYMDEPSTGLDPASRNNLWNVVKAAKKGRAIILTTHSMEEAEVLCERLGIFVDGQFACIGNPKELTARYGGTYDLTITTPEEEEAQAEALALSLSSTCKKVYSLAGTQKFELPTKGVDLADVFTAVEKAKAKINIQAWGIANTTLEDVFIKVAGKERTLS